MNKFIVRILFTVGLFAFIFSPAKADALDDISALIKAGNTTEISKYLAPSVDMSILTDEGTYTKAQADALIKDFFKKHQPSSAKVIHKITSNPNYLFAVLTLTTNTGTYRTSFALKNVSGKFLVTELRFEINKD